MGEVVRIESPNALVKQIKACVERADKAAGDADYWKHKAGAQLIKLKERCEHGEWLPYLKTIGITKQRASELMQTGADPAWPEKERERIRKAVKRSKAKAKSPLPNGPLEDEEDEGQSLEERWQNSLANFSGDVLATQPYWDKHFPGWKEFSVPSHIKKLVREAATEFALLAALISKR